jgi:hypothetical protein
MKRLDSTGATNVTVIREVSRAGTAAAADLAAWIAHTCYIEKSRRETREPRLVAVRLERVCRSGAQAGP